MYAAIELAGLLYILTPCMSLVNYWRVKIGAKARGKTRESLKSERVRISNGGKKYLPTLSPLRWYSPTRPYMQEKKISFEKKNNNVPRRISCISSCICWID
jgi:hypothetical protein